MTSPPNERRRPTREPAPSTENIATNDSVDSGTDYLDVEIPIARRTMRLVSVADIAPEIAP